MDDKLYQGTKESMIKVRDSLSAFRDALHEFSVLRASHTHAISEQFENKELTFLKAIEALEAFELEAAYIEWDLENFRDIRREVEDVSHEITECLKQEGKDLDWMRDNNTKLRTELTEQAIKAGFKLKEVALG